MLNMVFQQTTLQISNIIWQIQHTQQIPYGFKVSMPSSIKVVYHSQTLFTPQGLIAFNISACTEKSLVTQPSKFIPAHLVSIISVQRSVEAAD